MQIPQCLRRHTLANILCCFIIYRGFTQLSIFRRSRHCTTLCILCMYACLMNYGWCSAENTVAQLRTSASSITQTKHPNAGRNYCLFSDSKAAGAARLQMSDCFWEHRLWECNQPSTGAWFFFFTLLRTQARSGTVNSISVTSWRVTSRCLFTHRWDMRGNTASRTQQCLAQYYSPHSTVILPTGGKCTSEMCRVEPIGCVFCFRPEEVRRLLLN